ncbi:vWA domain-containing protein [Planococcus salinarum]|uniref:vWA domain-containing protein n=1 Tax=Planococcus salinarum TaxID=622695 RepID=UPI000E3CA8EA|nr:VWA domain-containing protein [Planococcus salinarum]TAA72144.1 VWA domain-containing protein [Planococcus salinarum]
MGISNWGLAWTLLMPIALILYYFYRKKYKDQPVSSILYWRELMKEMQASPYPKKLQHHALFYLQLAALLLLVLALLNPYLKSESLAGGEFIFVIDTSASMLAGSPSQLDKQKTLMKELAAKAQGKPVTIINAGSTPEILANKEVSLRTLERTIDDIAADYESAEMEKTLLFAETLPEGESGAIHIFTDSLDRSLLTNKTGAAYEVHANAEELANVSIRQFGVAEGEASDRAIVQVVNDSEEAVAGRLELSGGEYGTSTEIGLQPGEEKLIPFENLPKTELWQADLTVDDDYRLDNRAYAYMSRSADTVIIDNALHGLVAKGVQSLGIRANAAPEGQLSKFGEVPLVTNQSSLIGGDAPVLLIGRNDEASFEVAGAVETVEHPVFAYAPMENVYISALYPGFEEFETLATVDGEPFIQLSPGGDIVVLADIQATDWPLSPSFPLFLWSAINELTGTDDYIGTFWPKEQRAVTLTSPSGEWEIFKGDEYQSSFIEGRSNFQAPPEPGIYQAVSDGETKNFIVQLSNEEKTLSAGQNYSAGQAVETETSTERSVIPWLLLMVLLLMLAEWEVYRRGTSLG